MVDSVIGYDCEVADFVRRHKVNMERINSVRRIRIRLVVKEVEERICLLEFL